MYSITREKKHLCPKNLTVEGVCAATGDVISLTEMDKIEGGVIKLNEKRFIKYSAKQLKKGSDHLFSE